MVGGSGAERSSHGVLTALGTVAVLAYVGWMSGPYLRSIVVRDAAVTTWVYAATAPIAGVIDENPLLAGQRVGAQGRIASVVNARIDPTELDTAVARVAESEARVASVKHLVDDLIHLIADREVRSTEYAKVFMQDLDAEIELAGKEIEALDRHLALEAGLADRSMRLARTGNASQSTADAAAVRVAEIERERVVRERMLALATLRLAAAKRGTYLLKDGTDPTWAFRDFDPLRVELLRLEAELTAARSLLSVAQAKLKAAGQHHESIRRAEIEAPPGALIWTVSVGSGTAVVPGGTVASWIDCSVMLVDVPTSDAEASLLDPGSPAEVILEGQTERRAGRVILTRGAASPLGRADIAAVAKGHRAGTAQVLVHLSPSAADIAQCPIGRAAYVNFPDVGLIDILRVRLRL